jgi:hypothetical protein
MKKITIILISFLFLTSCQQTREGFKLKKKSAADEFLVEKKSPLVLPPEYGKLPVPQEDQINQTEKDYKSDDEIKNLISNKSKNSSSTIDKKSESNSIEKSILEKIK